ncbi:hypothetical protein KUCAC02_036040, partial [Chaenocephalus aceratus]
TCDHADASPHKALRRVVIYSDVDGTSRNVSVRLKSVFPGGLSGTSAFEFSSDTPRVVKRMILEAEWIGCFDTQRFEPRLLPEAKGHRSHPSLPSCSDQHIAPINASRSDRHIALRSTHRAPIDTSRSDQRIALRSTHRAPINASCSDQRIVLRSTHRAPINTSCAEASIRGAEDSLRIRNDSSSRTWTLSKTSPPLELGVNQGLGTHIQNDHLRTDTRATGVGLRVQEFGLFTTRQKAWVTRSPCCDLPASGPRGSD